MDQKSKKPRKRKTLKELYAELRILADYAKQLEADVERMKQMRDQLATAIGATYVGPPGKGYWRVVRERSGLINILLRRNMELKQEWMREREKSRRKGTGA